MTLPRTTTRPTHHLALSDGATSIGLTLCDGRGEPDPLAIIQSPMAKTTLQTTTGDPSYGSMKLPFVIEVQKDWSGGRGQLKFRKDATRYYDAMGVDTRQGGITLGPRLTAGTDIRKEQSAGTQNGLTTQPTTFQYATSFVAQVSHVEMVEIALQSTDEEIGVWVDLCANTAGRPGSSIGFGSLVLVGDKVTPGATQVVAVPLIANLTIGSTYWIVVAASGTVPLPQDDQIGIITGSETIYQFNPSQWELGWSDSGKDGKIWFRLTSVAYQRMLFFEYHRIPFALISPENGGAPRLFYNGLRGIADDNSNDLTKTITNHNIEGLDLADMTIQLVAGPGAAEPQSWRKIIDNTSGEVRVWPPWQIPHGTTTEWAIIGMDSWREVTGHGLTKPVTDVCVVDDIVYFAQGDATNIRRGRLTAAGTWDTWIDDGTNRATFLDMITDSTGKRYVWKVNASTSKASRAEVKAWGTNLVFGSGSPFTAGKEIICGNPQYKVTNMIPYGNPVTPWIMKEDCFGNINNDIFAPIPLAELRSVRSEQNGRAATPHGVYLFFSMLEGFQRYYDNYLNDVGPDRDEGLQPDWQGPIVAAQPYPGGIITGVDAGAEGYSSVMYYNQLGWHPLTYFDKGNRISDLTIQVTPSGDTVDRLWIGQPNGLYWIPISTNPRKQKDYPYVAGGWIVTSWIEATFAEIVKYWHSLSLFTEDLNTTETVDAYYQTDSEGDDDPWHLIGTFNLSPEQTLPISTGYDVTGKRIRFKLVLHRGADQTKTPFVISMAINAIVRIPPATTWSMTFLAATHQQDQQGRWSTIGEEALRAQLASWASSRTHAAPLIMTSPDPALNGRRVLLDPASIRPVKLTVEMNGQARTIKAYTASLTEVEAI